MNRVSSMPTVNRRISLASRPVGFPRLSDFQLVYAPLTSPGVGEVLVRSTFLSLDPSMREWMSDTASHTRAAAVGQVVPGCAVGAVVESGDPAFEAGDTVLGKLGWQEYAILPVTDLRKVDLSIAPISTALGVLGIPGLTAYFGLLDICNPQPGETVVVSAATGAVGMIAGQIAKIMGCRVVGLAGPEAGTSWLLDELGFDAACDYRATANGHGQLGRLCPEGVDVYFDNVGGRVTDAVIRLINDRARIAVCGQLSQDNLEAPEDGPRWLEQLVVKQAKVHGFQVSGFADRFPEGRAQLTSWLKQGRLKYREEFSCGIESAPQAFIGMLRETNQGKQLVRLTE